MNDSAIICNKVIDVDAKLSLKDSKVSLKDDDDKTKTIPTNFNEKKVTCKRQNFHILLAFLLITIALLIAGSVYCYVIKYRVKQKLLLPLHDTKLKQAYINNIGLK